MNRTPSYDTSTCKFFFAKAGYTILNLLKSGFSLKASTSMRSPLKRDKGVTTWL